MTLACSVRVRGVVQGVGFRPFVLRLARAHTLAGWVQNGEDGVEIHLEGDEDRVRAFLAALEREAPPAASISVVQVEASDTVGVTTFTIRESRLGERPTTRISPDLAVCPRCVAELFDPADPRHGYPYINCTDCGPRYSIVLGLPYDRVRTTMRQWRMDDACAGEYHDPESRRFHAQPVACPRCGPHLALRMGASTGTGDALVIQAAAAMLREGSILAIKGIGGYHLACDARNGDAVRALRDRKFRKEKPFALMARDLSVAEQAVERVPVLARANRAHRPVAHRGERPVVGQAEHDRVAGPAVGAVDVGVAVAAIGRVGELGGASRADRQIGRDPDGGRALASAVADHEVGVPLGRDGRDHHLGDAARRRRRGRERGEQAVERSGLSLDVDLDAVGAVEHPAAGAVLAGEAIDERAEADALDDPAHADPPRLFAQGSSVPAIRHSRLSPADRPSWARAARR